MDRAGIETMLMNYYRHIDRTKIQFDFLCNKSKPGAYDDEIKNLGGRIFHTPGLNPLKYGSYLRYMHDLFSEYPEYKIIEAHNGALGVYALNAAKKSNIPIRILHAHGASITKDLKYPLKLFCKSQIHSCATHYFACGREAARCYFGDRVVNDGNYFFVPNAIDVNKFRFDSKIRAKIRNDFGLDGKFIIGHVGRFMKQKNHRFLLQFFSELVKRESDAMLIMLGDGQLMDDMKGYAKDLGVADKVVFVGNVANVNEWYSAFDVFVLPSIWEGLPVVGVEAQAAGLPCIFSDAVTDEIGLTDRAMFVSLKASVNDWVDTVLSTRQLFGERSDTSDIISQHHYNIQFEADKLEKKYFELLTGI